MVRGKDEGATRRLAGRPRTPKGHEAQLAVQASQITQKRNLYEQPRCIQYAQDR